MPVVLTRANITAIYKKAGHQPTYYRPVSVTSVCCDTIEHIIFSQIMDPVDKNSKLVYFQHGFRQKHSTETQFILMVNDLAKNLDNKGQIF